MHSLTSPPKDPTVTESELIALAEHGTQEGSIEAGEHQMIRRIFDFSTLRAGDIMVHRHQIFSLDGQRTIGDCLAEIIGQSHYRIPLYAGNPEEINRVITLPEILREVAQGNLDKTLAEAGSEPLFVPPNQPVDRLLDVLRANKDQPDRRRQRVRWSARHLHARGYPRGTRRRHLRRQGSTAGRTGRC
jgi:putative hemolysin